MLEWLLARCEELAEAGNECEANAGLKCFLWYPIVSERVCCTIVKTNELGKTTAFTTQSVLDNIQLETINTAALPTLLGIILIDLHPHVDLYRHCASAPLTSCPQQQHYTNQNHHQ